MQCIDTEVSIYCQLFLNIDQNLLGIYKGLDSILCKVFANWVALKKSFKFLECQTLCLYNKRTKEMSSHIGS